MKLIHLADLHIGKRLAGYSLLDDQRYILKDIIKQSRAYDPDCFLIAGDIFDRRVPGDEALDLFSDFIYEISRIAPVYMISGNHDSGVKVGLHKKLLENTKVFIEGEFNKSIPSYLLHTGKEEAEIFLFPFVEPRLLEKDYSSYTEMAEDILSDLTLDPKRLNILVSHQFYLPRKEDKESFYEGSERIMVGGLDDIPTTLLKQFDYCALGHIHGIRNLGSDRIRYAGTPMKYSPGEGEKSLNCIEVTKDSIHIDLLPLAGKRDVRTITGSFEELYDPKRHTEDYVSIDLTDTREIYDVKNKLLEVYPNLLGINFRPFEVGEREGLTTQSIKSLSALDLLDEFFKLNGEELSDKELEIARKVLKECEQ